MGKICCPCGYVHDLVKCPYETGWVAIRHKHIEAYIGAQLDRERFRLAKKGTPDWDRLIAADFQDYSMSTEIFECPQCHRLIWHRRDKEPVRIFTLEKEVPNQPQ
jgi:hypothetical protein